MREAQTDLCGKCGAEIDPVRKVNFTLRNRTRVCEPCFVRETPRQTQPSAIGRPEIVHAASDGIHVTEMFIRETFLF